MDLAKGLGQGSANKNHVLNEWDFWEEKEEEEDYGKGIWNKNITLMLWHQCN